MSEGFIPKHGGYKRLLSYQRAETIYDATVRFCNRHFERRDRTIDQMVQAATSKETEIKLTNVARASLGELLEDYRDFLRTRNIPEWDKSHPYAQRLSELLRTPDANYDTFKKAVEQEDPAIAANAILGLTKVAYALLTRQIKQLETQFLEEGGLRERMTKARLNERDRQRSYRER